MKFKNTLSETAMFSFKGSVRKAIDYIYTTEDKEEIEFLQKNPAWEEIKEAKQEGPEAVEKPVKVQEEIKLKETKVKVKA